MNCIISYSPIVCFKRGVPWICFWINVSQVWKVMVSVRRPKANFWSTSAMYGVSADNLMRYRTKTQNDFSDVLRYYSSMKYGCSYFGATQVRLIFYVVQVGISIVQMNNSMRYRNPLKQKLSGMCLRKTEVFLLFRIMRYFFILLSIKIDWLNTLNRHSSNSVRMHSLYRVF